MNFQESTTILNGHAKKPGNLLYAPRKTKKKKEGEVIRMGVRKRAKGRNRDICQDGVDRGYWL